MVCGRGRSPRDRQAADHARRQGELDDAHQLHPTACRLLRRPPGHRQVSGGARSRRRGGQPARPHVSHDRLLQRSPQNCPLLTRVGRQRQQEECQRQHSPPRLRRVRQSGHTQAAHRARRQDGRRFLW